MTDVVGRPFQPTQRRRPRPRSMRTSARRPSRTRGTATDADHGMRTSVGERGQDTDLVRYQLQQLLFEIRFLRLFGLWSTEFSSISCRIPVSEAATSGGVVTAAVASSPIAGYNSAIDSCPTSSRRIRRTRDSTCQWVPGATVIRATGWSARGRRPAGAVPPRRITEQGENLVRDFLQQQRSR